MDDEQTKLLVEIKTKLDDLIIDFQNHLHFHRSMSVALVSVVGTLLVALIIALLV